MKIKHPNGFVIKKIDLDSTKFLIPLKIMFVVKVPVYVFVFFAVMSFDIGLSIHNVAIGETIECTQDKKVCKGTYKMDVLIGNKLSNKMNGMEGTDYIVGLFGNDHLIGYNGSDFVLGGPGNDVIHGGANDDEIMGGTGNDNITGGLGADEIMGGEGNDTILGGRGPDTIIGGPNNDIIVGGPGSDFLDGSGGNDVIYSANQNSTDSDYSRDIITCGEGRDEAWINIEIDKDEASKDCEIVHEQ